MRGNTTDAHVHKLHFLLPESCFLQTLFVYFDLKKTSLFNIRTLYVAQKRSDGTAAVKYALWNLVVIIATQLNRQQVSGSDMYF